MDYKEMAEIVKARGDKILEEKRIRAIRIRRVTSAVSSICAAAVCLGLWHNNAVKKAMPDPSEVDSIIAASETTVSNHDNITTTCAEDMKTTVTASAYNKTTVTSAVSSTASKYDITENISSTAVTSIARTSANDKGTSIKTSASSSIVTSKAATPAVSSSAIPTSFTSKPYTTLSTAATTVTTTTADNGDIIIHERSYFMNKVSKKFLAFFTAATIMPSPLNTNAVYDTEILSNPMNMENYFSFGPFKDGAERFSELRSDETQLDVNGDGVFDVKDVHLFWRSTHGDYSIGVQKSIDIDKDGYPNDLNDGDLMMKYFLYYNKLKPEYFDFDYYSSGDDDRASSPYLVGDEITEYETRKRNEFIRQLISDGDYLHCFYDMFNEAVNSGKIDLDVNGSGKFDLADVVHIYAFENRTKRMLINADMFNYSTTYAEMSQYMHENGPSDMDGDVYERCLKMRDDFLFAGNDLNSLGSYALLYYFYNNNFVPEYTDSNYYSYLTKNVYDYFDMEQLMYDVYRYCEGIGIAGCDMRENVSSDNFEVEYAQYLKKVQNGKLPEPDVNMDGMINMVDYVYIDDIYNNCRYGENEEYSRMIIDNFLNNFDLNGNGISGDCVDCMMCQTYVMEKLEINKGFSQQYEKFKYHWINNNVSTDQYTDGTNCLTNTLYPTSDPDLLFSLCPNYVYAFRYNDYEERQEFLQKYVVNVAAGILPEPDVNMDGVIDENDYYCAEITRYSQTHTDQNIDYVPIEVMQNYVTNFDLDESGLSGDYMDTLMIREYVGYKIGEYPSDLELRIPVILGYKSAEPEEADAVTTPLVTSITTTTTTATRAVNTNTETSGPDWSLLGITTTTTIADIGDTENNGKSGDANCDEEVDLSDSVLIMQALANPDKYDIGGTAPKPMTLQGKKNADVDKTIKGVTAGDALRIQQYLLHNISEL